MKKIIIKQGKQSSNDNYGLFLGETISFDFIFTEESVYDLGSSDQYDWNKLFGFTGCLLPRFRTIQDLEDKRILAADFKYKFKNKYFCLFMPWHWNSARFAWRYNKEEEVFELTFYIYFNGERKFGVERHQIYQLFKNKKITAIIEKYNEGGESHYRFVIKDYRGKIFYFQKFNFKGEKNNFLSIKLPTFFGGNCVAPKNIKIKRNVASY